MVLAPDLAKQAAGFDPPPEAFDIASPSDSPSEVRDDIQFCAHAFDDLGHPILGQIHSDLPAVVSHGPAHSPSHWIGSSLPPRKDALRRGHFPCFQSAACVS